MISTAVCPTLFSARKTRRTLKLTLLLFSLTFQGALGLPAQLQTVKPQAREVSEKYYAFSKAIATGKQDFVIRTPGTVSFVSTKQGQKVFPGEKVFSIDEAAALEARELAVQTYNNALLKLKANRDLHNRKVISKEQLKEIELLATKAKLGLEEAENKFSSMVMTSSIEGVLSVIPYQKGDFVQASNKASFNIIDPYSHKIAYFYLPINLAQKVQKDLKITANDTDYAAKITHTSQSAGKEGAPLLSVSIASTSLTDGELVQAEFSYNKRKALMLPSTCLTQKNGNWAIYAVQNGDKPSIKTLYVRTGVREKDLVEVITDAELDQDTKIVLYGNAKLEDGGYAQLK